MTPQLLRAPGFLRRAAARNVRLRLHLLATALACTAAIPAAHAIAGTCPDAPTITTATTIGAGDLSYDNMNVVVQGATLTIVGHHTFCSLTVQSGGIVNHVEGDPGGLDLSLSSCTVDGTSEITVSGRGYAGGAGPGSPGNGSPYSGGAAYGGDGGDGSGSGSPGSRAVYGSIAQPTSLGSGGGWYSGSTYAGSGGGAVHLSVSGTLHVDGAVSADGDSATSLYEGGGSGGSLWLEVGRLEGNGVISADGGASYGGGGGGGGSGGRIAVYYTTDAFTGPRRAWGGAGAQRGGAGTVLTKTIAGRAEIKVINTGAGSSAARTTLTSDPITPDADFVVKVGGQLAPLGVQIFYSLSVDSGGIVTCATGDTNRVAIIVSTNCTVDGTSEITVSGRGYAGGAGPGSPGNGSPYSGGAAYGGDGGDGSGGGSPGSRAVYGSIAQPTSLGSGGGWYSGSTYAGSGGGAVHLSVSGTLHVDGAVSADGDSATSLYEGGGSGGSLWLEVGRLEGNGVISADGGASYGGGGGGGGSGGRIAVYYTTDAFTGPRRAWGGAGAQRGGAGTVLTKTIAGRAEIKVINTDAGPSAARTTLTSDPITPDADFVVKVGGQLAPLGVQIFYSLSVDSGGIVTCATGDTNRVAIIVSTNCTVDGTSEITATGRGYAGGAGPGSPGNGSPYSGGAAYGGDGGDGSGSGSPGSRAVYGSIAQPTSLGSGGGWYSGSTYAGSGGGAVHLSVSGTLHVDGEVSADGDSATGTYEGGGSGGSLWLEVGGLAGNGVISADGGASYGGGGGGGGSGGRIAVYYTTDAFTGQRRAWGGVGAQRGGAGTVLTKTIAGRAEIKVINTGALPSAARTTLTSDPITPNADFVVKGGGQLAPLGVQTFYSLSVDSGGIVTCATGDTNRVAIIVSTNCTVDGTSAITATGRGYAGGAGPGSPGYVSPSCGGAAYGGDGGDGSGSPGSRAVYGSIAQPTSLGSGGGWYSDSTYAGAGGGAVHLSVSGTLHVDGEVSADGDSATGTYEGGGSGGSLWLEVGGLAGNGVISANGGASYGVSYGGGGSGGRIAVYSADCFENFDIQVNGGAGGGPGGMGTILLGYASSTLAGIEDQFLPPSEPASPSADLVAGLNGITLVPFDGIPIAGAFAHTFTGIPAQTQAAKVVFRAKAGAGANVAADRVTLGYSDAGGFHPFWRRYFGSTSGTSDPGLTGRPWVTDKDTTFVFDLANLQRPNNPPLDVTSLISVRGHVDLVVEGNTGVDYARLTYGNCNNTVAVGDWPPVGLLPTVVALRSAPNPFAQRTRLTFELPHESDVRLAAFDLLGRRVQTLYEGSASAGVHHLDWSAPSSSGGRLQAGVYFIRLEMGERTLVRRVVLTK